MITEIIRSAKSGMGKIFLSVIGILMVCCIVVFESCEDKVILKIDPTYCTSTGVGVKWIISRPFPIPEGKFLRAMFYYEQNGKRSEVIVALPACEDEYVQTFTIAGSPDGTAVVYYDIYAKTGSPFALPLANYISPLDATNLSNLSLYSKNSTKIPLNQVMALVSTVSLPDWQFYSYRRISSQSEEKTLPPITFFLKFSITDNPNTFVLTRNLDDELKGKTLEEQLKYIEAERDRRMNLYQRGLAAIGDINTPQVYLMRINAEIGLEKAEKSGTHNEILKAKALLEKANKDFEILQ